MRFRAAYVTDPDIDELVTRCAPPPDTEPGATSTVLPFPTGPVESEGVA